MELELSPDKKKFSIIWDKSFQDKFDKNVNVGILSDFLKEMFCSSNFEKYNKDDDVKIDNEEDRVSIIRKDGKALVFRYHGLYFN